MERGHIKWDESFNRQPYILHVFTGFRMSCVSNDVSFTMRCRTQLRTIINPDFFFMLGILLRWTAVEITGNVCRCQTVLPSQSRKYYRIEHLEKLIVLIVCGRQVRFTRRLLRKISEQMGFLLRKYNWMFYGRMRKLYFINPGVASN